MKCICACLLLLAAGAASSKETPRRIGPPDGKDYMDAAKCGACHNQQYKEWCNSAHSESELQCYECHGILHSGTLTGCKWCHESAHRKRFANWPEVTRFDDESGSDHMCMVCHNPHIAKLKVHLSKGCFQCHGEITHTVISDVVHREYASSYAPIEMDTYARERAMAGAWMRNLPRPLVFTAKVGTRLGTYVLCFLILLPIGYSASAIWGRRGNAGGSDGAHGRDHAGPSQGG